MHQEAVLYTSVTYFESLRASLAIDLRLTL
jgi:hypothetical protein